MHKRIGIQGEELFFSECLVPPGFQQNSRMLAIYELQAS